MNAFNIFKSFRMKAERGWDTLYVAIDLHGTLVKPGHEHIEFYPHAIDVMKWFNNRSDFKVILWTSSHDAEIKSFLAACALNGIHVDFINENPIEPDSALACFDKKFYFNILLDDKAGFVGETDWLLIKTLLLERDVFEASQKQPKSCNTHGQS